MHQNGFILVFRDVLYDDDPPSVLCLMASPKLALLWEIQITCLSDTNVVRQPEMSRGGIPPLGPIWVNIGTLASTDISCTSSCW